MAVELRDAVAPTDAESRIAKESSRLLSPYRDRNLRVQIAGRGRKEQTVELPAGAVRLLVRVLTEMAEGNAVTLIPIHAQLTTQEAADLLGVSRPFLISLLEEGRIPHTKVGTHRRIRFDDLARYKQHNDRQRLAALDQLSELDQESGLQ